jgi:hypothetical protein
MKKYTSIEDTPMKFHNFYVWVLNPLQLLLYLAVLVFLVLGLMGITAGGSAEGLSIAIVTGSIVGIGIAFLALLIAEVLLAKRKKAGVFLLLLGYLLSVVNAAAALFRERTTLNAVALAASVIVGVLVFIYYRKRRNLFS